MHANALNLFPMEEENYTNVVLPQPTSLVNGCHQYHITCLSTAALVLGLQWHTGLVFFTLIGH